MTQEQYSAVHNTYIPKHAKKWYTVYRVLGPAGPEVTETVLGLDEVKSLIRGCWDWDIFDMNGNPVSV